MIKSQKFALISLLLAFCIFALFQIKFKVQNLNQEIVELKRQVEHEKSTIYVLKAEWAYLNKPVRLQYLAEKYLNLSTPKIDRMLRAKSDSIIVSDKAELSDNKAGARVITVSNNNSSNKRVKWQYKKRLAAKERR